ncbi:MAG: TauD/TfdA family dioxygenase [Synechococcales cyanobacterium K44_A2020_017]|nr:TauD/TfdA family dioxygenase [Synechococcales cyanobacterium K32_A2020_035]MBF2093154.1 TauD/TfdA family dioxygenase [Synechococcales cyanobacterium K44_A2020_017]
MQSIKFLVVPQRKRKCSALGINKDPLAPHSIFLGTMIMQKTTGQHPDPKFTQFRHSPLKIYAKTAIAASKLEQFREQAAIFQPVKDYDLNLQLINEAKGLLQFLDTPNLSRLSDLPYIEIHGLPTDCSLPSPPRNGRRPDDKQTWVSELLLLSIALLAQLHPLAYQEVKNGDLIHQIAPISGQENSTSSAGRVYFDSHTDLGILRLLYRPEYLALLALVNQKSVATFLSVLDDVIARLPSSVLQTLSQPRFRFQSPEVMHIWGGKIIASEPRPIIAQDDHGAAVVAANLKTTIAIDSKASTALAMLQQAVAEAARPVILEPGSVVIFNNLRCLHGRSAINGERWLQRLYARRSLEHLVQATGSNPVNATFSIRDLVLE